MARGNDPEFPMQKSGIRFQGQEQLTQSQDHQMPNPNDQNPQIYMKKFAVTSSNFYRTSQE